jgi:hemoglobin-like flavoprotein
MLLDRSLLQSSFDGIRCQTPDLTRRFYERLIHLHPHVRPVLSRVAFETQERLFSETVVLVLDHINDKLWLERTLRRFGARLLAYGATPAMLNVFGDCLLAMLAEAAGPAWSAGVARAWQQALHRTLPLVMPESDRFRARRARRQGST